MAVVADDDPDILRLVELELSELGLEVVRASDGSEALDLIRLYRPAIAVLDVMMPGADGFEVTRRLRELPETREIPVVLLTARSAPADEQFGHRVGADHFVTKPFDGRALRALVAELLDH
jgi:CheY-like chemotaxis protein